MTPEELTRKYERLLREALSQVWSQLQTSTNLSEITRLLEQGDLSGVLNTLSRIEPQLYAAIGPVLEDAVLESGRYVAEVLPQGAAVSPVFVSLVDPVTAAYVQQYVGTRIVEISNETIEAVRNRVLFSVNQGRPPAAAARDMRDVIGLNTTQELAVRNFQQALEEDPRSALSRELRDKRFDPTLERGEPLTREQIDRMVARYQANQLTFRTESIARTEAMTAISVGQDEGLRQGIASGAIRTERPDGSKLRGFWIATNDGRTRDDHKVVPGMNKDGIEPGGYFRTPLGPMKHPRDPAGVAANVIRCRCRIRWRWV